MMDADRDTLLDLITAINDRRRSLESAALRSGDSAQAWECRRKLRQQAAAVSRITRDLARHDRRHATLPVRHLEVYVDNLIDAYLGAGDDPGDTGKTSKRVAPPG